MGAICVCYCISSINFLIALVIICEFVVAVTINVIVVDIGHAVAQQNHLMSLRLLWMPLFCSCCCAHDWVYEVAISQQKTTGVVPM